MRVPILILLAGLALSAGPLAATPHGDEEIAKVIGGRVAGPPIKCIFQRNISSTRIIDGTAILYTMRDGTILINQPGGAAFLHRDLALVTDTHNGDRLCDVDIVRLYDAISRTGAGSIGLGDFIPYPRPAK